MVASRISIDTVRHVMSLYGRGVIWNGEREVYRYARMDDMPAVVDMLQDPEVGRWLWFCPISPEEVHAYFTPLFEEQAEDLAAGRVPAKAVFVIEDQEGRFLGETAAVAVDGSPGGYEIGYQLCRDAWGRGVGMRAGLFACAFAVHVSGAYRIEASCIEGNVGSRRILERLGLVREGRREGYRLKDDGRHPELLYGARVRDLDTARLEAAARDLGLGTS